MEDARNKSFESVEPSRVQGLAGREALLGVRAQQPAEQVYLGFPDAELLLEPLAQAGELWLSKVLEALVRGVARPAADTISAQEMPEGV